MNKLLTSVLIFVFGISFSQKNYQFGYVVNNNLDTIYGEINFRKWKNSPHAIEFKLGDKATKYQLDDIFSFSVENEKYIRAVVDVYQNPDDLDALTEEKKIITTTDTVFLQALFLGSKSLYYHRTEKARNHFYIKDGDYTLLEYKRYIKVLYDRRLIKENNNFVGQIGNYLSDCSSMYLYLSETNYTYKSLISLFDTYYQCNEKQAEFIQPKGGLKSVFGLTLGTSIATISFTSYKSSTYFALSEAKFNASTSPTGGVFVETIFPRRLEKWSLYNELLFTSYNLKGEYYESVDTHYQISYTEIGMAYFKINNLIRYNYGLGSFQSFLNFGISNGLGFVNSNQKLVRTFYTSQTLDQEFSALKDP
ncbi:MAG: hypothetical protein OEX22_06860, partial [Cyclobacteriaceae bacterium]|nr:hypothetical protein [Cyclobacteriaceae bacterium]